MENFWILFLAGLQLVIAALFTLALGITGQLFALYFIAPVIWLLVIGRILNNAGRLLAAYDTIVEHRRLDTNDLEGVREW